MKNKQQKKELKMEECTVTLQVFREKGEKYFRPQCLG